MFNVLTSLFFTHCNWCNNPYTYIYYIYIYIYPLIFNIFQAFHLCHYNGFKETFVCPQGTRYDPSVQECRFWYTTHCLKARRPLN